jgi:hypothetical protein
MLPMNRRSKLRIILIEVCLKDPLISQLLKSFTILGMTSTPINDITMSLKEGRRAILFLENNLGIVNENPDEERIYNASDFQAALKTGGKLLNMTLCQCLF